MRRLLLILLAALMAVSAQGKPVSPYLGGYDGAKPGFVPVYRSGADTWPDTWAAIATDCIRAYSADSIIQGGVGSYDIILDSAKDGIHGLQTNESLKVVVSSDDRGKYFSCGAQQEFIADRPALASYALTAVVRYNQDGAYSEYATLETAAPSGGPTRHGMGFGRENTYGLGWLGNADFDLGNRSGVSTATWHVITTIFCPGASAAVYLDGVLRNSWVTPAVGDGSGFAAAASNALYIGGSWGGGSQGGGAQSFNRLRCILIYVPSAGRREAIEAILMRKYL